MDELFDDEKPFRARLSATKARSARESYYSTKPSSKRSGSGGRGVTRRGGRGRPVNANYAAFQQRVVAKITARNLSGRGRAKARAHLDYLQRDGAAGPDRDPRLFGPDPDSDPSGDDFYKRCADDRHQFRLILSPEHGDRLELDEYTRDVMAHVEDDLDAELDWIAVSHHNTDHPHVHIVIRGHDLSTDEDLYIAPQYMHHGGLRGRAQEVATYHLGPRTETEIRAAQERQVEQDRLTDLDRNLLAASDGHGRLRLGDLPGRDAQEQHIHRQRISYLEQSGLATSTEDHWQLADDLRSELRERGRRRDIMHRLREADRNPGPALRSHRPAQRRIARVAHRGLADDHSGERYIIADGSDGRTYHIDDDHELADAAPPGAVIEIGGDAPRGSDAVLTKDRLTNVVDHAGPTFLDHPDTLDTVDNTTERGAFYHELKAQIDRRHAFLRKHGVSFDDADRPHYPDLRALEKRAALDRLADEHNRKTLSLHAGDTVQGQIVERLELEAGDYFALATDDDRIALLPADRYAEQAHKNSDRIEVRVDQRGGRLRHYVDAIEREEPRRAQSNPNRSGGPSR